MGDNIFEKKTGLETHLHRGKEFHAQESNSWLLDNASEPHKIGKAKMPEQLNHSPIATALDEAFKQDEPGFKPYLGFALGPEATSRILGGFEETEEYLNGNEELMHKALPPHIEADPFPFTLTIGVHIKH